MDLELKPLPDNLEYVFLEEPSFLHVIISSQLSAQTKGKLVSVLKKHKEAFAWKRLHSLVSAHHLQAPDTIRDDQDTGIICPITDSPWVSPIHCVPKKGGITVVTNENDELVITRTFKGWQVCIDYRKLNEATAKDHFPLPFMDQMLERLAGNKYSCFLDGECLSGYAMPDHHSIGECLAIFHVMIEDFVEVFMDDSPSLETLSTIGAVLEFNIEIKDRKGTENVAADHLSRIKNDKSSDDNDVDDNFPRETLMEINTKDEPWFADFANYLEPYLSKICSDGIIRRCVSGSETRTILDQCHYRPIGGHYGPNVTAKKVLESDAPVTRTASAAAKPCQGDSFEFYLITGSIYTDQRGTVVFLTVAASKNVENGKPKTANDTTKGRNEEVTKNEKAEQEMIEPTSIAKALSDSSWVEAMQEELLQFKLQQVWILVDLPNGKKAIGTKWVFKNKKDERGIMIRNKARLVAQGHRQEEGIDYEEVFAPVARIEAIRLFLAYASFMGFLVYQMDVKSAFLYGTIEEGKVKVTSKHLRFKDPDHPNKFYKVVKALYGLHQAPRAWYETLANYLV
ncbi:putative ribonuclease H-like domain-containing protein [Tanacetum coccineum]